MKRLHYQLLISIIFCSFAAHGQDESFIYGKVYTDDDKVYEGPIRWGKEEVYWTDIFNASKHRNDYLHYLSDRDREQLDDRNMTWYSFEGNVSRWFGSTHWRGESNDNYVHQFSCRFGDIRSLRPTGSKHAELELRNGTKIEVDGEGYNDIGLDIKVMDSELGEMEIYWNRIDRIEFMPTPSKLENRFGKPLYGTVEAFGTKFTGFIQWDHDERVSTDKLDGDSDDGDVAIEFGKIKSIERRGGRGYVVLQSGRELWLDGSNDVSDGHRGVIVENKDFPSIDIPWDEFKRVTFENAPGAVTTYADFKAPKELNGNVTAHDGKTYSGRIVYDLDEAYDFELLQGTDDEIEYAVPFRNLKKIVLKGEYACAIELKNGKRITLEEGQDVSRRNQGLLVFDAGKDVASYIPWHEVSEIEFR